MAQPTIPFVCVQAPRVVLTETKLTPGAHERRRAGLDRSIGVVVEGGAAAVGSAVDAVVATEKSKAVIVRQHHTCAVWTDELELEISIPLMGREKRNSNFADRAIEIRDCQGRIDSARIAVR